MHTLLCFRSFLCLLGALTLATGAGAQSGGQAPGAATIEGQIVLDGAASSGAWFVNVQEFGTGRSLASQQLSGAGPFQLDVPVGASGRLQGTIRVNGRVAVAGSTTTANLVLPERTVVLEHGRTTTVDFVYGVARITGTLADGAILGSAVTGVLASTFSSDTEPTVQTFRTSSAIASPGAIWEVPILAGIAVRVRREARVGSLRYHLPDVVDELVAGTALDLGVETPPAATEALAWSASLQGSTRFTVARLSAVELDSPTRFVSSSSVDAAGSAGGSAAGLVPGTYWPLIRFNNFRGYVSLPRSRVGSANLNAPLEVSLVQATLEGHLAISGTAADDDVTRFSLRLREPGESAGDHHSALTVSTPGTVDYSAVLSEGSWEPSQLVLSLDRSPADIDGPLDETVEHQIADPAATTLAASEIGSAAPILLPFARIHLDLRDPQGTPIGIRSVTAWCAERNVLGETLSSSKVTALPEDPDSEVVTLEVPAGECELQVRSSNGQIGYRDLWVRLSEGDEVWMDLHPPLLTLQEPSGTSCAAGTLLVRGTASDPLGVASVTIAGVEAVLAPASIPGAPNEVEFAEQVALASPGFQTVEVVATDLGGADTVRLLAVLNNQSAPAFDLPTSPIATALASYHLVGLVSDDDQLASVRLDGVELLGGAGTAEFSIDEVLELSPGDNTFLLEAEDSCGNVANETLVVRRLTDTVSRVTGGGHFSWPGSPGGDRTTFGLVAGFGGPVKGSAEDVSEMNGNFTLVRHFADGGTYRVRSGRMLSLTGDEGVAVLRFEGTVAPPEGPGFARDVVVSVWVLDGGEPGAGLDRLWIEVKDLRGAPVLELSLPAPASSEAAVLAGGNVQVR